MSPRKCATGSKQLKSNDCLLLVLEDLGFFTLLAVYWVDSGTCASIAMHIFQCVMYCKVKDLEIYDIGTSIECLSIGTIPATYIL